MFFHPVQQGQFILCQPGENSGHFVAFTQFGGHICHNSRNTGIIFVCIESHQQVEFGIFLTFDSQIIQWLDRRITGVEIGGPRSEGDYLQFGQSHQCSRNRNKILYHLCQLAGGSNRIFRDIGMDSPEPQVVGAVEHAAVGIAAAVNQVVAVIFRGSAVHNRAAEKILPS